MQSRRWSINMVSQVAMDGEDLMSPVWHKPTQRKATCKLTFDAKASDASSDSAMAKESSELERETDTFIDTATKLRNLVGQTCVRMTDYLQVIAEKQKKDPDMFEKSESNKERLVLIAYLESVANYRLGKWLHQLEPRRVLAPSKPQKQEDSRTEDLLSEVKFALTRMEMLASTLAPLLQQIVSDAKKAKPTIDACPVSPTLRHPVGLAHRRGIVDVEELAGISAHLERLLETTEGLAHNPAPAQKVAASVKAVMAVGRFKKLIPQKVKSMETAPAATASPRPDG